MECIRIHRRGCSDNTVIGVTRERGFYVRQGSILVRDLTFIKGWIIMARKYLAGEQMSSC